MAANHVRITWPRITAAGPKHVAANHVQVDISKIHTKYIQTHKNTCTNPCNSKKVLKKSLLHVYKFKEDPKRILRNPKKILRDPEGS